MYRVHAEYIRSTYSSVGDTLQEVEQKVGMYNVGACAFPFPFPFLSFPSFKSAGWMFLGP